MGSYQILHLFMTASEVCFSFLINESFSDLNFAHISNGQAEVLFSILWLYYIILDTSSMFSLCWSSHFFTYSQLPGPLFHRSIFDLASFHVFIRSLHTYWHISEQEHLNINICMCKHIYTYTHTQRYINEYL